MNVFGKDQVRIPARYPHAQSAQSPGPYSARLYRGNQLMHVRTFARDIDAHDCVRKWCANSKSAYGRVVT